MHDDAFRTLEQEHQQLTELFERVGSPDEDRSKVLDELLRVLATHVAVEEQVLVPVVRAHLPDSSEVSDQLSGDHHRVEKILTLIERRKVNSPDMPGMVSELLDIVHDHIAQADQVIFPGLRRALTSEQLDELDAELRSDERRTLTHSHPLVPDNGPLAGIAGKAAEVVDRLRDRSADINRSSS